LEKDSLSVYIVIDKDFAAIIDSFIMETQSINYPSIDFFIYINLFDDSTLDVILDSRKQKENSDSIILYKHSYFQQAFILHQDRLFQANFMSYFDITNHYILTELFAKQPIKQCVYFKKPPPNFYDVSQKGEIEYEDRLITWGYDYYYGEWRESIKIYFYLDNTNDY
jgi:hypothetical protein